MESKQLENSAIDLRIDPDGTAQLTLNGEVHDLNAAATARLVRRAIRDIDYVTACHEPPYVLGVRIAVDPEYRFDVKTEEYQLAFAADSAQVANAALVALIEELEFFHRCHELDNQELGEPPYSGQVELLAVPEDAFVGTDLVFVESADDAVSSLRTFLLSSAQLEACADSYWYAYVTDEGELRDDVAHATPQQQVQV